MGARLCAGVALAMSLTLGAGRREYKDVEARQTDISLWIDERQIRMFSGKKPGEVSLESPLAVSLIAADAAS